MPDFPPVGDAPRIATKSVTVSFLCAGGDRASVQLDKLDAAVTGGQIAAFRAAVGRLSNGAVVSQVESDQLSISLTNANPFDETYAEAQTKLVLVFQDNGLNVRNIAIPAPDESYFGTDGITIIPPDAGATAGTPPQIVAAAITNVLTILNAGSPAGTFAFLKGYRSKRAGKLPRPRDVRPSVEPGAGDVPPPAPGE